MSLLLFDLHVCVAAALVEHWQGSWADTGRVRRERPCWARWRLRERLWSPPSRKRTVFS